MSEKSNYWPRIEAKDLERDRWRPSRVVYKLLMRFTTRVFIKLAPLFISCSIFNSLFNKIDTCELWSEKAIVTKGRNLARLQVAIVWQGVSKKSSMEDLWKLHLVFSRFAGDDGFSRCRISCFKCSSRILPSVENSKLKFSIRQIRQKGVL